MTELTNDPVQKWDKETWKDRLMLAFIGLGGILTAAWCGIIAGAAWWLFAHAL